MEIIKKYFLKKIGLYVLLCHVFIIINNVCTEDEEKPFRIQCLFLGKEKVGKTQIVNRLLNKKFKEKGKKSNEILLHNKTTEKILFQIFDGPCDEIENTIFDYIQTTNIFFFVYDISKSNTFTYIKNLFSNIIKKGLEETIGNGMIMVNNLVGKNIYKKPIFILIGNKIDLESERKVSKEEAEKFAKDNNMEFIEVSAKTGEGIFMDNNNINEEIINSESTDKSLESFLKGFTYDLIKENNISSNNSSNFNNFKKNNNIYDSDIEEKPNSIYVKEKLIEENVETQTNSLNNNNKSSNICKCCSKCCIF